MPAATQRNRNSAFAALAAALLLSLVLSACGGLPFGKPPTATAVPTDPPTSTPIPTDTPVPTDTPTRTPEPTATATATPDLTSTAAVEQTATAEAQYETVLPVLEELELDPEAGRVAWVSEKPNKLSVQNYMEENYFVLKDLGTVSDFVLQTQVDWDTSSGFAGCGINFRAEDDMLNGAHLALLIMRLQNAPAWDIEYHKFNQFQTTLTGGVRFTNNINDEPNSTNRITLVAKGGVMTTYINGEKEYVSNYEQVKRGLISFLAWQESGETTCEFHDGWVWVFEE